MVIPEAVLIGLLSGGGSVALLKIVEKIVSYVGDAKQLKLKAHLAEDAMEQKASHQMQTFVQQQLVEMEEQLNTFRNNAIDDVHTQLDEINIRLAQCQTDLEECKDTIEDRLTHIEKSMNLRRHRFDEL